MSSRNLLRNSIFTLVTLFSLVAHAQQVPRFTSDTSRFIRNQLISGEYTLAFRPDGSMYLIRKNMPPSRVVTPIASVQGLVDSLALIRQTTNNSISIRTAGRMTAGQSGMVGDSSTNNNAALTALLTSSADEVFIPKGVYLISGTIGIYNVTGKRIILADGAKILNTTSTLAFLFQNCRKIEIQGGKFGLRTTPTANCGGGQHIMQFDRVQGLYVHGVEILNSCEMGIAVTNSNDVRIEENNIHNTFRDGVYFRYSANVKVLRNRFDNIKDDAISFHDKDNMNAGEDSEKSVLTSYGYSQSSNALIEGNTITNAYQGIVSIGGAQVRIRNNNIRRTVNSGIGLANLANDGAALVRGAQIEANTLDSTGQGATINGTFYANTGQSTMGRAAIAVISLNSSGIISLTAPKRSKDATITGNIITNSGALGLVCTSTDGLNLANNQITNATVTGSSLGGNAVELWEVTRLSEEGVNTITDTRTTPQHVNGVSYDGANGNRNRWIVTGRTGADIVVNNSPLLGQVHKTDYSNAVQGNSAQSRTTLSSSPDSDLPAGFYNMATSAIGGITDPLANHFTMRFRHENGSGTGGFWAGELFKGLAGSKFYKRSRFDQAGAWGAIGWSNPFALHDNEWFPVSESMTPAAGDLFYYNGTSWTRLPKGTDGQFLKMVSGSPAWSN